jgi:hypothetical protein
MLPFGWERRPDLEFSHSVVAFGVIADMRTGFNDDMCKKIDRAIPQLLKPDSKAVIFDLRSVDLSSCHVISHLNSLGEWLSKKGLQLVCLLETCQADHVSKCIVLQNEHELYDWMVGQSLTRNPNSPAPLFRFTQSELEELQRNGIELNEVIRDLERVGGAVA